MHPRFSLYRFSWFVVRKIYTKNVSNTFLIENVIHFRLLSRVLEAAECSIESNVLFTSFDLESKDAGENQTISKREFHEYVHKIFPKAKRVTKRISQSETVSVVKGIALQTLGTLAKSVTSNFKDITKFLTNNFTVCQADDKQVVCSCKSLYKVNGYNVTKVLTFHKNLTWSLSVGDKTIDLPSLKIDAKFVIEENSIKTICKIIEKLDICSGVEINRSVICSRFHTIETFTDGQETQTRRIRSIMCGQALQFNARSPVCKICQKMTFTIKNEQKENQLSSLNIKTISTSKETFKKLIPCASDAMLELLVNQAQNSGREARGHRWSQTVTQTCLQLYSRSPAGYKHLRQTDMLLLPSPKVLILYKNRVKHKPGFQEEVFR